MSYMNEKEKMKADITRHYHNVWLVIKITFITLAATLAMFCLALIFIGDTEPPKIEAPSSVVGYVGDKPAYKKFISVSDNDGSDPKIEVDASKVNTKKAGTYYVNYTVTDKAGNVSTHKLKFIVKDAKYNWDVLEDRIKEIIEDGDVKEKSSTEAQIREIYRYVNAKTTIDFTDESNTPNIDRNNWESDWIEEAILTLDSKEGDCYSYYALSKAFFEYFGIENDGVKRAEGYKGSKDDGTHFWNVVKVGNKWYYYDATSLKGTYADGIENHCLVTQEAIDEYRASDYKKHDVSDYFYKMSSSDIEKWSKKLATKELD